MEATIGRGRDDDTEDDGGDEVQEDEGGVEDEDVNMREDAEGDASPA